SRLVNRIKLKPTKKNRVGGTISRNSRPRNNSNLLRCPLAAVSTIAVDIGPSRGVQRARRLQITVNFRMPIEQTGRPGIAQKRMVPPKSDGPSEHSRPIWYRAGNRNGCCDAGMETNRRVVGIVDRA